jgi:lysophospholipid acyltransferase (LPLAT)-like uncharacterized protein
MRADSAEVEQTPDRRVAWIARIGVWLLRLLGRTWRIRVSNDEPWRRLRGGGQPVIFAFWHGQMLPLLHQHRDEGVAVLISEHGDGEIIARAATRLGYRTVRGSTSRGATRALLEAARVIQNGCDAAITPDGPRGPARSVAPGVLVVSQRTRAPIIPTAVWVSAGWHLKSWDRFLIPRPFSRVCIAYGDPVTIESPNARDAVDEAPRVRDLIVQAEQQAHG